MKKIITKGTDTYRATCSECGTAFTYEREDVHHNYMTGGDWVSCPHCAHSHRHFGAAGAWGSPCGRGDGSKTSMSVKPFSTIYRNDRWLLGPPGQRWD